MVRRLAVLRRGGTGGRCARSPMARPRRGRLLTANIGLILGLLAFISGLGCGQLANNETFSDEDPFNVTEETIVTTTFSPTPSETVLVPIAANATEELDGNETDAILANATTSAPTTVEICPEEMSAYYACFASEMAQDVAEECDTCVGASIYASSDVPCREAADNVCLALAETCRDACGPCTPDVYAFLACAFSSPGSDCELDCGLLDEDTNTTGAPTAFPGGAFPEMEPETLFQDDQIDPTPTSSDFSSSAPPDSEAAGDRGPSTLAPDASATSGGCAIWTEGFGTVGVLKTLLYAFVSLLIMV